MKKQKENSLESITWSQNVQVKEVNSSSRGVDHIVTRANLATIVKFNTLMEVYLNLLKLIRLQSNPF